MMTTLMNYSLFSLSFLLLLTISSSQKTCEPLLFKFFIQVHSNCTIERLLKSDPVPPTFDAKTNVESTNVLLDSTTGLLGRLYRPKYFNNGQRVPILIYFHGGGFVVGSPFDRNAQNQLLRLSSIGKMVILSVDYKLAPEHKIPVPYRDGDDTLNWLALQASRTRYDKKNRWLKDVVDFNRVFIGGQSSGGNIAYNVAMRFQKNKLDRLKFGGLILLDPYFLTAKPLPSLMNIPEGFRNNITGLWKYVCPKSEGLTDTRVNPSLETSLGDLNPGKVLVCVAEKDPLIDGVKVFYDVLAKQVKKTEYYKTDGRGHVFDTIFPDIIETSNLYTKIASFIKEDFVDREPYS